MSDKAYSLTRALGETLNKGLPVSGLEREAHLEIERAWDEVRPLKGLRGGGKYPSLLVPLSVLMRADPPPLAVTTTGAALVGGLRAFGRSDLMSWSAVVRAGALMAVGLKDKCVFWQVASLPQPVWGSEYGQNIPAETDCTFSGTMVEPKRLAAIEVVSKQLLIQSPSLEEVLKSDLARQLGSLLDQAALVGSGPANNQPSGLSVTSGVRQITFATAGVPSYKDFARAERLVGESNVDLGSYSVIVAPSSKEVLQLTPAGGVDFPTSIWDKISAGGPTRAQSSMQVSDNRAYCGAFQMLTLCVWGALEIQIDPFTFGATGQVRLIATLWCDVAIRLPSAFAISEAITPLP